MTLSLITRQLDTDVVLQRATDGYINATQLCKASGKLFGNWRQLDVTQGFLDFLTTSIGIPIDQLVQSKRTGPNAQRGTWVHPQVAINLAQWLSPAFAVQVTAWVMEVISGRHPSAQATQALIESYVSNTPALWQARFPPEFYRHVYRLWGKADEWFLGKTQHKSWVAKITRNLVYDRAIEPEVMDALCRQNPRKYGPGRERKHMQHLTKDIGDPTLQAAVLLAVRFLRIATSKEHLLTMLDAVAPKLSARQQSLPLL